MRFLQSVISSSRRRNSKPVGDITENSVSRNSLATNEGKRSIERDLTKVDTPGDIENSQHQSEGLEDSRISTFNGRIESVGTDTVDTGHANKPEALAPATPEKDTTPVIDNFDSATFVTADQIPPSTATSTAKQVTSTGDYREADTLAEAETVRVDSIPQNREKTEPAEAARNIFQQSDGLPASIEREDAATVAFAIAVTSGGKKSTPKDESDQAMQFESQRGTSNHNTFNSAIKHRIETDTVKEAGMPSQNKPSEFKKAAEFFAQELYNRDSSKAEDFNKGKQDSSLPVSSNPTLASKSWLSKQGGNERVEPAAIQKDSIAARSRVLNNLKPNDVDRPPINQVSTPQKAETTKPDPGSPLAQDTALNRALSQTYQRPVETRNQHARVEIGQIDVIVQATQSVVKNPRKSSSTGDLASRLYLRRL